MQEDQGDEERQITERVKRVLAAQLGDYCPLQSLGWKSSDQLKSFQAALRNEFAISFGYDFYPGMQLPMWKLIREIQDKVQEKASIPGRVRQVIATQLRDSLSLGNLGWQSRDLGPVEAALGQEFGVRFNKDLRERDSIWMVVRVVETKLRHKT